jgi:phage replication-related protein YjqB (UPF0714/DUF867 family)
MFIGEKTRRQKGSTCEKSSMADRSENFAKLAAHEKENTNFRVRSETRRDAAAVVAPHGGTEPGTSQVAEADLVLLYYGA